MTSRLAMITATLGLAACGPRLVSSTGDEQSSAGTNSGTGTESGIESTEAPSESGTDSTDTDPSDSETGGLFLPSWHDDLCGSGFYCTYPGCDRYTQDCPEAEKCVAYSSSGPDGWWPDATRCVAVVGDIPPGQPCTSDGAALETDDCDASGMCVDGVCRAFCTGTSDDPVCPDGFGCTGGSGPNLESYNALAVCLAVCDPLAQDCIEGGCYWGSDQFLCNTAGAVATGEPCGFVNDCASGNACVDASLVPDCMGAACCVPFCDLANPDCASLSGTQCEVWYELGGPPQFEDLGACLSL